MNKIYENGVNMDEFLKGADADAGVDQAQLPDDYFEQGEENTSTEAETEIETEVKANAETEVSVLDLIDDNSGDTDQQGDEKEHAKGHVPMDQHLKLRKRTQAAEASNAEKDARIEELESQGTRTDAGNSGNLEIDADDFVTVADLGKITARIEAKVEAKAEKKYEQERVKDLFATKKAKAETDNAKATEDISDYLEVIQAMSNLGLSKKAKQTIANADNSAEAAYQIGCQILNRTPAQKRTPKSKSTPPNRDNNELREDASEDEIFKDIYGG